MSRFLGKNIIPISLMKEKENKAATATRSASCSIGKWGNYKFTSTRYQAQSIIAQTNEDIKKDSSFDRDRSVSPPAEPVKPKKFFKSRNSTQARVLIIPASDVSSSTLDVTNYNSTTTSSSTTATSNKRHNASNSNTQQSYQNDLYNSSSLGSSQQNHNHKSRDESVVKPSTAGKRVRKEKQCKEVKEDLVEQQPPPKIQGTRCSTRTKKIVNYNLEEESIYSRIPKESKKEISTNETTTTNHLPPAPQIDSVPVTTATVTPPVATTPVASVVDHPPIVLRISKVSFVFYKNL